MTAGFQIFGDNGNTQIDENYYNFACTAKGTISMPAATISSGGNWAMAATSITIDADYPMLFINPKTTMATVSHITSSDRSHTFQIRGGVAASNGGPLAETFSYFLFDKPPTPGLNGSGIQVFRDDGTCSFDSNYPPMRFVDVVQIPNDFSAGLWTYPSGDYAVSIGQGRRSRVAHPVSNQAGLMDAVNTSATQVKIGLNYVQFGGPGSGSSVSGGNGYAIVIDCSRL